MLHFFPPPLVRALEKYMTQDSRSKLAKAALSVHEKYMTGVDRNLSGALEPLAYALFRMPSTFAAVQYVLSRLQEHDRNFSPTSLLDIGCGPGTACFALKERYPDLQTITAIDRNRAFLELFQTLVRDVEFPMPEILCREATLLPQVGHWDVGVCSYMLGELEEQEQNQVLERAVSLCSTVLILEPGTPSGYETILRIREWATLHSCAIVAPCPHSVSCPMRGSNTWCHVRVRLQRPHFQQELKEGTLGYEDEPLCYLILRKQGLSSEKSSRIVDTPQKRKGHVNFHLCQPNGQLSKVVVSKKNKDLYSQAKELEWGDLWPHNFQ